MKKRELPDKLITMKELLDSTVECPICGASNWQTSRALWTEKENVFDAVCQDCGYLGYYTELPGEQHEKT